MPLATQDVPHEVIHMLTPKKGTGIQPERRHTGILLAMIAAGTADDRHEAEDTGTAAAALLKKPFEDFLADHPVLPGESPSRAGINNTTGLMRQAISEEARSCGLAMACDKQNWTLLSLQRLTKIRKDMETAFGTARPITFQEIAARELGTRW